MPSPKAVLRDIADLGLDPTKPHVAGKNGRLNAAPHITGPRFTVTAPPEKPVQNALKELPAEPPKKAKLEAPAPEPEPAKVEEVKADEQVADDAPAVDESSPAASGKKGKKAKVEKPAS